MNIDKQNLIIELKKSKLEFISDLSKILFKVAIFIIIIFSITSIFFADNFSNKEYQTEYVDWYDNVSIPSIEDETKNKIALIPINGMILNKNLTTLEDGVTSENIIQILDNIKNEDKIKAIILRIDSPGGTVLDSEKITKKLIELRKTKKVYALFENMATSGGYYIASYANKIFSYPETITGSIGVIMQFPNFKKAMDKFGIDFITLTSGKMKDMGSPFNEFSDDQKEIFNVLINEVYDKFVARVSEGRNIPIEKVKEIADGRIYSGIQAKKLNLIDSIEGVDGLKEELKNEKLDSALLIKYSVSISPIERIIGPLSKIKKYFISSQVNTVFYYL